MRLSNRRDFQSFRLFRFSQRRLPRAWGRPKQNFIARHRDARHPLQRLGPAIVIATDDSAKLDEKVLPSGRVTWSPERSRARTPSGQRVVYYDPICSPAQLKP